jgi:hypothetical protein
MKVLADNALAQELYFGLMTAELNQFSSKNFDRIASVVNLVSIALAGKVVDRSVEAAIDGCMRCLNEVDAKFEKYGSWRLTEYDIMAVCAGITKIEESLPLLTLQDLRNAKWKLEEME